MEIMLYICVKLLKMEKLEITIQKSVPEVVSINLPHYRMGGCHVYCVYNDKNCIQVCFSKGMESISVNHAGLAFNNPEGKECDSSEFFDKHIEVTLILSKLINQS